MKNAITLTRSERMELERRVASRTGRAEDARRARVILLLAEGHTWDETCERLECSRGFVDQWNRRFSEQRIAGLHSRHIGQVATVLNPRVEARILEATRRAPGDGATQWSTRKLGAYLNISHMMVARVWQKHGLKPHRIERYMASNDPNFETKAADIIGLYLNPPAHAAVFCVDEKTAIQALDRKDPVLPLSPGRAERHGFEYYRHGTLSLYAAFNTKTGEVLGKTTARHTSAEFVAFLTDIVVNQPRGKEIHVIADNLSAHKTGQVNEFLQAHHNVHLHFTPTYSSWLNQVELWFAKIERDVIARGVFTSVPDLKRKLMRYIRQYNKRPQNCEMEIRRSITAISTKLVVTGHPRLTTTQVAAARPGATVRDIFDAAVAGLVLRVGANGSKLWLFRFKLRGKSTRISLGSFPTIGLAEARALALESRTLLKRGIDPRSAKRPHRRQTSARSRSGPAAPTAVPSSPKPAHSLDLPPIDDKQSVRFLAHEYVEGFVRKTREKPDDVIRILNKDVLP